MARAARRPELRPRQEPRDSGVPRGLRGGADGPYDVVIDSDPARLLEKLRASNQGGDVHLVGGPRTIEAFRAIGALDRLELVVLPLLLGDGMQLTPSLSLDTGLTFERERALPGGAVEIVYGCGSREA